MSEESPFDADSYYERIKDQDDFEFEADWDKFERTLKGEARFFSRTVAATLAKLFDRDASLETRGGNPVVLSAGPGENLSSFYRARCCKIGINCTPRLNGRTFTRARPLQSWHVPAE